jgi:hypothetical protein
MHSGDDPAARAPTQVAWDLLAAGIHSLLPVVSSLQLYCLNAFVSSTMLYITGSVLCSFTDSIGTLRQYCQHQQSDIHCSLSGVTLVISCRWLTL